MNQAEGGILLQNSDSRKLNGPRNKALNGCSRRRRRLVWTLLLLTPICVLTIATMLTPSSLGHSTHMQLGLPPCGFLLLSGIPCPGCGLTTAFAHMVRFELTSAWHANPFGVVLFAFTVASIPVSFVGLIQAKPVLTTLKRLHTDKILFALCILSLSIWLGRVSDRLW